MMLDVDADTIQKAVSTFVTALATGALKDTAKASYNKMREVFRKHRHYAGIDQAITRAESSPSDKSFGELYLALQRTSIDLEAVRLAEEFNQSASIDLRDSHVLMHDNAFATQANNAGEGSQTFIIDNRGGSFHYNPSSNESPKTQSSDIELISSDDLRVIIEPLTMILGKTITADVSVQNRKDAMRRLRLVVRSLDTDCDFSYENDLTIAMRETEKISIKLPDFRSSHQTIRDSGATPYQIELTLIENGDEKYREPLSLTVPPRPALLWRVDQIPKWQSDGLSVPITIDNVGNTDVVTVASIDTTVAAADSSTVHAIRLDIPWNSCQQVDLKVTDTGPTFRQRLFGSSVVVDARTQDERIPETKWQVKIAAESGAQISAVAIVVILLLGLAVWHFSSGRSQPALAGSAPTTTVATSAASSTPCPDPTAFSLHLGESGSSRSVLPPTASTATLAFEISNPQQTIESIVVICKTPSGDRYYFSRQANDSAYGTLAAAKVLSNTYVASVGAQGSTTYTISTSQLAQGIGVVVGGSGVGGTWPLVCVDSRYNDGSIRVPSGLPGCSLDVVPSDWRS